MRRPNIILCTCDQLRAFEVGCYGNPVIRTPNMDRLTTEGFRFVHAVTNFPVCMAARSVLLSGQYNRTCTGGVANVAYPGKPGSFDMPEYPEPGRPHLKAPTLAECLREAGYRTAVIGKWHIHSWPHDVGFEHYVIPRVHHCHTGQSYTEDGGPEFVPPGYSVEFEAERVVQFLEEQGDRNQPFFLFYNISPPHCPLADAPDRYLSLYHPEEIPLRANVDPDRPLPHEDYWLRVYRYDFRYYSLHLPYTDMLPDGYGLRHLIAEYYGLTTWADDALGRVLDALDRLGLAENTIVLFTADHGDNLGSHGLVQKCTPNEEAVRVPFLLRWPTGRLKGVNSARVASLVDVAPTLLELANVPIPGHMHGRSLVPHLRNRGPDDGEAPAFIEMPQGVAVRTARYKMFVPFRQTDSKPPVLHEEPSQLFDLDTDPYELHNLAGLPEYSTVQEDLLARLVSWDSRTPWMR